MTTILKLIISYEVLGLGKVFKELIFSIHFLKTCQYSKTNGKVYKGLKYVFIKLAQEDLQIFSYYNLLQQAKYYDNDFKNSTLFDMAHFPNYS
jgi:hypothetical protein